MGERSDSQKSPRVDADDSPQDLSGVSLSPVFDTEWVNVNPTNSRNTALFSDMLDLDPSVGDTLMDPEITADFGPDETIEDSPTTIDGASPTRSQDSQRLHSLANQSPERYRIRNELGRGGMASVVDAIDRDLRRHVAMKVLHDPKRKATSPNDERTPLQRFVEEAQITGQLEHPNIVPVHDIGTDSEGNIYFTMKRVEGQSLREVLDDMRSGNEETLSRFGIYEFCEIFVKVCDAVSFAHSKQVIHRDMKPDNVMVGKFGEVQVMDWGLAKVIGRPERDADSTDTVSGMIFTGNEPAQHTLEGTISGTPAYMSPEQAHGRISDIDQRTDVFALGALLYELITLVPPFHARSSRDALRRAQKYNLLSPRQAVDELEEHSSLPDGSEVNEAAVKRAKHFPKELAAVAAKALAEHASERYQSVEELARDVERFIKREPVSVYRDSLPVRAAKWAGRHRVLATTTASVILVGLISIAVIAVLIAQSERKERDQANIAQQASRLQVEESQARLIAEEKAKRAADEKRLIEQEARLAAERDREAKERRLRAASILGKASDLFLRAKDMQDPEQNFRTLLQAHEACVEATLMDPDYERAYFERAYIELALGRYPDALEDFKRGNQILENSGEDGDPSSFLAAAMAEFTYGNIVNVHGGQLHLARMYDNLYLARKYSELGSPVYELASSLLHGKEVQEHSQNPNERRQAHNLIRNRLKELQESEQQLWEVHLFAAIFAAVLSNDSSDEAVEEANNAFASATRIRSHIPLATYYASRYEAARYVPEPSSSSGHVTAQSVNDIRVGILLEHWNQYVENFPFDPIGYYARAICPTYMMSLSQRTQPYVFSPLAEQDLARALEISPDFQQARYAMAVLLSSQGRFEEALIFFDRAFQRWDVQEERARADTYYSANAVDRSSYFFSAQTFTTLYLSLLSEGPDTRTFFNVYRALQERIALCEDEYRLTYDDYFLSFPALSAFYFGRALDYLGRRGDIELVRDFLNEFTPSPATPEADYSAGKWLARCGDFEEAARLLDRASENAADQFFALRVNGAKAELQALSEAITDLEAESKGGLANQPNALHILRLKHYARQQAGLESAIVDDAVYLKVIRRRITEASLEEAVTLVHYLLIRMNAGIGERGKTLNLVRATLESLGFARPYCYQQLKTDPRVVEAFADDYQKIIGQIDSRLHQR